MFLVTAALEGQPPVKLSAGSTLLGRNWHALITDNQCSRKQITVSVDAVSRTVTLTRQGMNPSRIIRLIKRPGQNYSTKSDPEDIPLNKVVQVRDGDTITLVQSKYPIVFRIKDDAESEIDHPIMDDDQPTQAAIPTIDKGKARQWSFMKDNSDGLKYERMSSHKADVEEEEEEEVKKENMDNSYHNMARNWTDDEGSDEADAFDLDDLLDWDEDPKGVIHLLEGTVPQSVKENKRKRKHQNAQTARWRRGEFSEESEDVGYFDDEDEWCAKEFWYATEDFADGISGATPATDNIGKAAADVSKTPLDGSKQKRKRKAAATKSGGDRNGTDEDNESDDNLQPTRRKKNREDLDSSVPHTPPPKQTTTTTKRTTGKKTKSTTRTRKSASKTTSSSKRTKRKKSVSPPIENDDEDDDENDNGNEHDGDSDNSDEEEIAGTPPPRKQRLTKEERTKLILQEREKRSAKREEQGKKKNNTRQAKETINPRVNLSSPRLIIDFDDEIDRIPIREAK